MKRALPWVLLLAGCPGAEPAEEAKPATDYVLCDGSDGVRLAIVNTGGHVDSSYAFSHPYGWQYLFVTGRCTFIARLDAFAASDFVTGSFSSEQADTLAEGLALTQLVGKTYRTQGGCPDAPVTQVISATGYAEGACGDEPPALIADTLAGVAPALELARSNGQIASGAVEVVAIGFTQDSKTPVPVGIAWPFAWPIRDASVLWTSRGAPDLLEHVRTLTGADAELARQLRSDAFAKPIYRGHVDVVVGETGYQLFVRDQVDPAWQRAIDTFRSANDPFRAKPITLCDPARVVDGVTFDAPALYEKTFSVSTQAKVPCGAQLCWDGDFREEYPVSTTLRLERPAQPRSCLGELSYTSFQADLQPLVDAYRSGYPKQRVIIDVSLLGAAPVAESALYDTDAEDKLCALLSTDACALDLRCSTIAGVPLDLTQHCLLPSRPLGCAAVGKGCDDALSYGTGPDGTSAQFSSSCLPAGYVALVADSSHDSFPACAP